MLDHDIWLHRNLSNEGYNTVNYFTVGYHAPYDKPEYMSSNNLVVELERKLCKQPLAKMEDQTKVLHWDTVRA